MAVDPRKEIAVALLPQDWDVIFQALGQQPYFQVVGVISKIRAAVVQSAEDTEPQG